MPKTSEMKKSSFLKQEDIGRGVLATVTGCIQENVAMANEDPEYKWCLTFQELEKPLALNGTNIQLCEKIFGSDDTDDWMGKQLVLYVDTGIQYQGKLVGGIRVRRPKTNSNGATRPQAAAPPPPMPPMRAPAPAQPQPDETFDDDDIPF